MPNDERADVYVSSTSKDLHEYRQVAIQSIYDLGHHAVAMEYYGALDQAAVDKCLADVRTCKTFVGIIAWRYGLIAEGYDKSITELEYREAVKHGIPSLLFLLDENAPWPSTKMDNPRDRIDEFRQELMKARIVDFFDTKEKLGQEITAALAKQLTTISVFDGTESRFNRRSSAIGLSDYRASRFWLRLDECETISGHPWQARNVARLKLDVEELIEHSGFVNDRLLHLFPQYGLHNGCHSLNVLAVMDALLTENTARLLSPLECAISIVSAYIHDWSLIERNKQIELLYGKSTDQGEHFRSYRTRFGEETRQIERWKNRAVDNKLDSAQKTDAEQRVHLLEGHILASYLRETASEQHLRDNLRHWLQQLCQRVDNRQLFTYAERDYQRDLITICISPHFGAPWLRRFLIGDDLESQQDRFVVRLPTGEKVNLAFVGLLLRLADLINFDASRAPKILFKHVGIENGQSVLEWNKHVSIVGWRLDVHPDGKRQPDLLYSAECEHPVHEKAIREYKTWIDAELSSVQIELEAQRRHLPAEDQHRYEPHLPNQARLDIRAAHDRQTDQPKYIYHDLQFRLDQEEIQQLLMGESLYGDPGLCIRELLQNALDALELRELRLKMKQRGESLVSVDGQSIRPGWVREPDGREQELCVELDWGTDAESGQDWLRVTDNGVGMSEELVNNYFTQIGKSYYRSPEFDQERAAMEAAGEVVSPISNFGIGILSCFMIADRIHMRTYGGIGTPALDITVVAASSLFWLRRCQGAQQGTEITLFLKPPYRTIHRRDDWLSSLRVFFGYDDVHYSLSHEDFYEFKHGQLDPALVACQHVVWPRYPLKMSSPLRKNLIRLDSSFHANFLDPISLRSIATTAKRVGCPSDMLANLHWSYWDWEDREGEEASGTRVRFWYPSNSKRKPSAGLPDDRSGFELQCRLRELGTLCEIENGKSDWSRHMMLLDGMRVDNMMACDHVLEVACKVGTRLWVDFRGSLKPRLTIDRRRAIRPDAQWRSRVSKMFARMREALAQQLTSNPSCLPNLLTAFIFHRQEDLISAKTDSSPWHFSWDEVVTPSWAYRNMQKEFPECFFYFVELERMGQVHKRAEGHSALVSEIIGNEAYTDHAAHDNDFNECSEPDFFLRDMYMVALLHLHQLQFPNDSRDSITIDNPNILTPLFSSMIEVEAIREAISSVYLQEAFLPTLAESWSSLGLRSFSGRICDAVLRAPGVCEFPSDEPGRCGKTERLSREFVITLTAHGYDVVLPLCAIPIGDLKRRCREWRQSPVTVTTGMIPFICGEMPVEFGQHVALLREHFNVDNIFCFLPERRLWSKRFENWSETDWASTGNLSALWDLTGSVTGSVGAVIWAHGMVSAEDMGSVGRRASDFFAHIK